jgi:hypothetical protein
MTLPRGARLAVASLLLPLVAAAGCSASKSSPSSTSPTNPAIAGAPVTTTSPGCATGASGGAAGPGDVLVPGDIPDNQAYVAFQSAGDGYRVDVPEGWARQQAGSTVTFADKFNSIRVEVRPAATAPSVAAAQASDVAALAGSVACFRAGMVTQVTRKAGPVVLVTYRAGSPPDAVTGKVVNLDVERYEFWHAGKQANVTLSSPHGSDNVDPWRRVTDSFTWTS